MTKTNSLQRGFLIIQELINCGIKDFFLAPGSRSTPLALATSKFKDATQHVFYDERALGFTALGFAKASKKPVVIITTSGTAVANLLPSVIEAFQDHVPLLLLTCDRPYELQDTGANQSISQQHIFSNHVAWSSSLPCSDVEIKNEVFLSVIDNAVYRSDVSQKPIHLNCMFREPFSPFKAIGEVTSPYCVYNDLPLLPSFKSGLILAGDMSLQESEDVLAFAEKIGWVIIPDCLSSLRFRNHDLIKHDWSQVNVVNEECCVIQVGTRCLDTPLLKALRQNNSYWILVTKMLPLNNPDHLCRVAMVGAVKDSLEQVLTKNLDKTPSFYTEVKECLPENCLSERSIYGSLSTTFVSNKFIFLSNSLAIRSFNLFCPTLSVGQVFANRGASGIDGIISTSIGVSKQLNQSGVLFIGDLSFCYDLNTLGQLDESVPPLTIVIINNQGGGIFRKLPIFEQLSSKEFEKLFQTPHKFSSFQPIAVHFNCDYMKISTVKDLDLMSDLTISKHTIVEIVYDSKYNE
jgi:2-succinyl-5-enolpyruvyl-6-hydroxy-3-cyclohexene-1-carboxylate synthase